MTLVTGSWLLDAALLLLPLLYWYMTRNFGYWKKLGIPYMKPTPFVGNMGGVVLGRQHMGEPALMCYHEASDQPFMGMFAFDKPLLMVKDPELVGRVMATDFSTFYATNFKFDHKADPTMSMSLFGQHGPEWKKLRTMLSPVFTSGKIKLMFNLVNDVGLRLVHHIEEASYKGEGVELKETMARFTTDVVSSIFMGVDAGSLEDANSPIRAHLRQVLRESVIGRIKTAMAFFSPKLLSTFHISVGDIKAEHFFVENTYKLIKLRKENNIVRNDLIDLLVKVRDEEIQKSEEELYKGQTKAVDGQYKLTNQGIAGQLMSFVIAGFDTSAATLTFGLFELAKDQQLQERTRQRIRQVLEKHGGQLSYQALNEMSDLTNVINETLRKYPPVNFLDREAQCDYQIPGTDFILPKDTGVVISVIGLHNDQRYWEEPHHFIPDRFNEENSKGRPSYTFLPFGEGPRMCIGMRVGYLQVKVGFVHILNNFEVYPLAETPTSLRYDPSKFLGSPAGKLVIGFRKIAVS